MGQGWNKQEGGYSGLTDAIEEGRPGVQKKVQKKRNTDWHNMDGLENELPR